MLRKCFVQMPDWSGRASYIDSGPAWAVYYEVEDHMQVKLFALHAEADTKAELITKIQAGLAELAGAEASAVAATTAKPANGAAKTTKDAAVVTLEMAQGALRVMREAIGGEGDPEKKGLKAIQKILKKHNVAASPELKPEQFQSVIDAAKAATPAAEEQEEKEASGDGQDF